MIADIMHTSFDIMYKETTMTDIESLSLRMTHQVYVHTWLYLTSRKVIKRLVKIVFILKILYILLSMIASIMHVSFSMISKETIIKDYN